MEKETNVVDDFLEAAPKWIKTLNDYTNGNCPVCGVNTFSLEELAKEVAILKEKAWKYDELCK